VHAEPLRDCDGRVVRWYGVNVDVDDRKRAEEALRKSERELRLLIETIPAAVWRATPDGESDYFNQRMARGYRYVADRPAESHGATRPHQSR